MNVLFLLIATPLTFLGFIPFLGWLNWITIPMTFIMILVVGNHPRTRMLLALLIIMSFFRFCIGGGII